MGFCSKDGEIKMSNLDDITQLLNAEEHLAESFKEVLLEHLKELQEKTGMTPKDLKNYIDRIMVM
jgi:DNA-binding MarR family transcriptional regulator